MLILQRVSLSRPAPAESPRLGTKQGQAVERCDESSLPIFLWNQSMLCSNDSLNKNTLSLIQNWVSLKTDSLLTINNLSLRFNTKSFQNIG